MSNNPALTVLEMIQRCAPNNYWHERCIEIFVTAQANTPDDDDELFRVMVNILADGLNYGNWPWTI